MKINISLDDDLVQRIDSFADSNYMSRSGFISFACTQYLNSAEVIVMVKDMSLAMRKIADSGKIDSETMEQLKDFERLSMLLMSGQK